jgi:hypothetical protein
VSIIDPIASPPWMPQGMQQPPAQPAQPALIGTAAPAPNRYAAPPYGLPAYPAADVQKAYADFAAGQGQAPSAPAAGAFDTTLQTLAGLQISPGTGNSKGTAAAAFLLPLIAGIVSNVRQGKQRKALEGQMSDYEKKQTAAKTALDLRLKEISGNYTPQLEVAQKIAEQKPAAPEKTAEQIRAEAYAKAIGEAQGKAAGPAPPEEQGGGGLSDAAKRKAAIMYNTTGALPPLGMGKAARNDRRDILNYASEVDPQANVAANQAAYRGATASRSALQKVQTASHAFAETARKNAEILKSSMKGIADTGSPLFNKPLRSFDGAVLGSKEQAAFNAARTVLFPEFARLLSTAAGNGVVPLQMQEEASRMLKGDYSVNQMIASIDVLIKDAENKNKSYTDSIKMLDDEIGAIGAQPVAPSAAPAAAPALFTPKPGGFFDRNKPR